LDLSGTGLAVVKTGPLTAGTYYATGVATGAAATASGFACDLNVNGAGPVVVYGLSGSTSGTATVTQAFTVAAGDKIYLSCSDNGPATTDSLFDADLTAIKVGSSHAGTFALRHASRARPSARVVGNR
jgi:hypothetical protein